MSAYVTDTHALIWHLTADARGVIRSLATIDRSAVPDMPDRVKNPNISIMSGGDVVSPRHGWNIAIEVRNLLKRKLGRKVRCTVEQGVGY